MDVPSASIEITDAFFSNGKLFDMTYYGHKKLLTQSIFATKCGKH